MCAIRMNFGLVGRGDQHQYFCLSVQISKEVRHQVLGRKVQSDNSGNFWSRDHGCFFAHVLVHIYHRLHFMTM